jgi:hypothetical protein
MKFNLLKAVCLSATLIGFASCTDLDEDLKGDITTDISVPGIATPGDNAGPDDGLNGAFSQLRSAGTANHSSYYSVQELTSDEQVIAAKGGDWFDGGILIQLHRHTYGPVHSFINNAWSGQYGGITTCNELLASGLDEAKSAQVRALRAYFYLRLLDMFGNVKLITAPGTDAPQATRSEVFDFVETELLDALGVPAIEAGMDLSGSPLGTEANSYRINQFGALGLLSKLYLNAETYVGAARYDEAAIAAGYVIDNGPYTLCDVGCTVTNLARRTSVASDAEQLEGYAAVFAPNNEGNPENIFTVEFDEVTATGMNFSQMNLHYSSQFTYNLDQQPWNGYATLEEFYNSYDDADLRKSASFLVGPQLDFGGSAILDYATDDDDIALSYTPAINELEPNSIREAGARAAKFSFQQFGRQEQNNDYPIVRLGEMYLVRGEAMARAAGNWNMSLNDVNVIRARAGMPAYTSIDADEFLAERGREMFQESSRRTDLIRFDRYNDAWWEKDASPAHVQLFPIPQTQIDASQSETFMLSQNPGY